MLLTALTKSNDEYKKALSSKNSAYQLKSTCIVTNKTSGPY